MTGRHHKTVDGFVVAETTHLERSDDYHEVDPRVQQVVQLRAARATWRAIGQQIGIHHETARKWYRREMKAAAARLDDSVEEHRVEVSQSIELIARTALRHMVAARTTDEMAKAGAVALRALAQYADLFALNAPKTVLIQDIRDVQDPEIIAAELRQILDVVSHES